MSHVFGVRVTTPLGADYLEGNGFSGSMRVFAVFNVEADDALSMRRYQWARQHHGIA